MRYAIVSDLHANLQAWNAVLLDIRSSRIDHIICLGDIVGYGPSPAELLQSAHENIHSFVMGNHDAVIAGKLGDELFNDMARDAIKRTRQQLGSPAVKFLGGLPLLLDGGRFLCVHGDFTAPEAFNYILSAEHAAASWQSVQHPLLFAGHTHEPTLYLAEASGVTHAVAAQDFELEAHYRYLVNVGSVGCPRDGDHRAAYSIFDDEAKAVFWRRIPYDLDAHRREYERKGLDASTSAVLNSDPRRGARPLRERLDFSPPQTPESAVTGATEIVSIRHVQRVALAWKLAATALLGMLVTAGAMAGFWRAAHQAHPEIITGTDGTTKTACEPSANANLSPMPCSISAANAPVPGWTLSLGDSRTQRVSVELDITGTPVFVMESARPEAALHIITPLIKVRPGMSLYPDALFLKSGDFSGTVAITVTLFREGEPAGRESRMFYIQEPGSCRSDGWSRARRKFSIPAKGCGIQLAIGGQFNGTVRVKAITLSGAPGK